MKIGHVLCLSGIAGIALLMAAAPAAQTPLPTTRPDMTVGQIMSSAFRGNTALVTKATSPTATDAEKKAFLDFSKALASAKAPRGDAAEWSKRTGAVLSAAQDVVDGKPNAVDALKAATNCASCHNIFR